MFAGLWLAPAVVPDTAGIAYIHVGRILIRPSNVGINSDLQRILDARPPQRFGARRESAPLEDSLVAKHEAICESSVNPFRRIVQADPGMEIHDGFGAILQELLGVARSFGPFSTCFSDVLLHVIDAPMMSSLPFKDDRSQQEPTSCRYLYAGFVGSRSNCCRAAALIRLRARGRAGILRSRSTGRQPRVWT